MKQQKPILHGRDHAKGGADEIPGLGASGGALEWEDVGVAAPIIFPTSIYVRALIAAQGTTGSLPITLSNKASNGVTVSSTRWTIQTAGVYLALGAVAFQVTGGLAINQVISIAPNTNVASTAESHVNAIASAPVAVGSGTQWWVSASTFLLASFGVGDWLEFIDQSSVHGSFTVSGAVYLFKMS